MTLKKHSIWILLLCLFYAIPVTGEPEPTASPSAVATAAPEAGGDPVSPLSLSEIAGQLEADKSMLSEIQARIARPAAEDPILRGFDNQVQELQREAAATLKLLGKGPTLQELAEAEDQWQAREGDLKAVARHLASLEKQRGAELQGLDQQAKVWEVTAASSAGEIPAALVQGIDELRTAITELERKENAARGQLLLELTRAARARTRANNILDAVRQAREAKVQRVLVKDGRPIWQVDPRVELDSNFLGNMVVSLESDKDDLCAFAASNAERFLLHLVCFSLLVAGLGWANRKVAPWVAQEPGLQRTASVFSAPVSTALLLTVFLTPLIYPRAPVMMTVILAALALVPASLVLRQLLERPLYPILNALVLLFCVDQLRALSSSQVLLTRGVFGLEMLGGVVFFGWFGIKQRLTEPTFMSTICRVLSAVFLVALLSNLLGYLGLSYWLGDGLLHSAYLAVFLFASVEVIGGLTLLTLRLPPLSLLASVRRDRPRLRQRLRNAVRFFAALVWLLTSLEGMAVLAPISGWVGRFLSAPLSVGALEFNLGGLLGALLALGIARKLSQVLLYVLELDVYPRFSLERGVDYTLSTVVHYVILSLGLLFGLAAIGVDSTKFTIVAGALSVGIGFGLQNIVNNFVSGLILLFERPIKVGDTIEVNGQMGLLKRVGLRASVVRTNEGAEIIVPNGTLLSTSVTNWTLSDPLRRLHLEIGVSYDSKPRHIINLLLQAAANCPETLREPQPDVLFIGLGESSLDFRLQVWTQSAQTFPQIQSELLLHVHEVLTEAGISIPFPHRTVMVESWPGKPEPS